MKKLLRAILKDGNPHSAFICKGASGFIRCNNVLLDLPTTPWKMSRGKKYDPASLITGRAKSVARGRIQAAPGYDLDLGPEEATYAIPRGFLSAIKGSRKIRTDDRYNLQGIYWDKNRLVAGRGSVVGAWYIKQPIEEPAFFHNYALVLIAEAKKALVTIHRISGAEYVKVKTDLGSAIYPSPSKADYEKYLSGTLSRYTFRVKAQEVWHQHRRFIRGTTSPKMTLTIRGNGHHCITQVVAHENDGRVISYETSEVSSEANLGKNIWAIRLDARAFADLAGYQEVHWFELSRHAKSLTLEQKAEGIYEPVRVVGDRFAGVIAPTKENIPILID